MFDTNFYIFKVLILVEWIIGVSLLGGIGAIECGAVIRSQGQAFFQAAWQIRVGDKVATENNSIGAVGCQFTTRVIGVEVSSRKERDASLLQGGAEHIQGWFFGGKRINLRIFLQNFIEARLDHVHIGGPRLCRKSSDQRTQLLPVDAGVGVARILEIVVGRKSNSHPIGTNGSSDCLNDLQDDSGSLLDCAAIFIRASVDIVVEELIEQISVGT